jgi:uncharacterized protein YdaU (DUF1376 family)
VNYYEHHIGDYQKKTAHLSLLEHGAYFLMMQVFYATEKPLPTGKVLYRMLRATSKAERDAIDVIVSQFWHKTAAGLVNGRASRELAGYHEFIEKQRAAGKASGIKRSLNHRSNDGSTTVRTLVEPPYQPDGQPNGNQNPTSQSHLPSPIPNIPTPTPPKGGAARQRRSPRRAERDNALAAWSTVVAAQGAIDDPKAQQAMRAIGGYSRIRLRTAHEEPEIRRAFVDAYVSAAA